MAGEMVPGVRDAVLSKMEYRSGQHGICTARRETLAEMIKVAGATGGDDGDVDGRGDSLQERQVVAIAGAVAVHAREQDFAGATASRFSSPGDDVETAGTPSTVGVNAPAASLRLMAGVDGDND